MQKEHASDLLSAPDGEDQLRMSENIAIPSMYFGIEDQLDVVEVPSSTRTQSVQLTF